MPSTPLLTLTLALLTPSTLAGFIILKPTSSSSLTLNAQQASSISAKFDSAISSYAAQVTTQPAYNSAWNELYAYESTGKKDIPEGVTATNTVVTYTTTPEWFAALPTDAQKYFASIHAKEEDIEASVIRDVAGGAGRLMGRGAFVCGAVAAVVVGVVVAL
ncbi:hypothetical protein P153DRAFT_434987 [Dothidotthia symphoricarpi CBS 119687]|uniref:Uncharacterized protein n=1 Tax=Dothidotthia symphoricarpi CBS 119687 TaxID=1392245 RepID=A0A6A6A2E8_9PLEO|nr:uncharacterized protein P153DRAFT_434987 [Dothidotthia symphoricarpi CBS 119687]KAF2124751.1 hypothetical protein P153DRAFT_434987 [Dothidotthia symphoricarpi CBS 119687]